MLKCWNFMGIKDLGKMVAMATQFLNLSNSQHKNTQGNQISKQNPQAAYTTKLSDKISTKNPDTSRCGQSPYYDLHNISMQAGERKGRHQGNLEVQNKRTPKSNRWSLESEMGQLEDSNSNWEGLPTAILGGHKGSSGRVKQPMNS